MLFDSSVRRELWRSFVGTLVVLLTVVLTMVLIRMLSQATKGAFAASDVSLMLGYTLISQAPMLVSLALFVSIVAVLSRFWRESEMVVWQVSGARQLTFLRPLAQMGWPVLLSVALLVLVARPWAHSQIQVLKERYEKRSDIARVQPGQFQSSSNGSRVFFIDSHSDGEKVGKNVFMVLTQNGQEAVITAQEGQLETIKGQRYLNLTRGERTQTDLSTGEKVLSRFNSASILVGEVEQSLDNSPIARSASTLNLLSSTEPDMRGELVWRLGMVWAALNMMLVGLGLASGNARRSSNWSLVFALLVFVIYFNLLSMSQTWVANRQLNAWVSLLAVHGLLTGLAAARIWWRDGGRLPLLKGSAS
ncbi:LPS export ABC transporter permease LptF [Aquabacterium sp.]|uniref:LPS export ABC transporter permease LptF n=1 Tax=Aquabacterium sp. TaxID=1872578 RepID=UPI003D6D5828